MKYSQSCSQKKTCASCATKNRFIWNKEALHRIVVSGISWGILNHTAKNQPTYIHSKSYDIQQTYTILTVILPCINISTKNQSMVPSHQNRVFTTCPGLKSKDIRFQPPNSAANTKWYMGYQPNDFHYAKYKPIGLSRTGSTDNGPDSYDLFKKMIVRINHIHTYIIQLMGWINFSHT